LDGVLLQDAPKDQKVRTFTREALHSATFKELKAFDDEKAVKLSTQWLKRLGEDLFIESSLDLFLSSIAQKIDPSFYPFLEDAMEAAEDSWSWDAREI
jgi:hypothetical protein